MGKTAKYQRIHFAKEIGAIFKPMKILVVAEHRSLGDATTLTDLTLTKLIGQ